jgi:transcription-repair coupling factor (superfamily II helicase)
MRNKNWGQIKDKLKTIAANVDTLTLTATPIPRTQFSLMAA